MLELCGQVHAPIWGKHLVTNATRNRACAGTIPSFIPLAPKEEASGLYTDQCPTKLFSANNYTTSFAHLARKEAVACTWT